MADWLKQFNYKKWQQRMPLLLLLLGLALLAHSLAQLSWRFIASNEQQGTAPPRQSSALLYQKTDASAAVRLQQLESMHLFGQAVEQPVSSAQEIQAPETRLKLTLKGVFAATLSEQAMAIIADPSGKEKTYHPGDAVPGGASLHAVFHDRVILKRAGKLETLRLPRQRDSGMAIEQDNNAAADAAVTRVTAGQKLKDLRDTLLKEPSKIWEKVRINPVFKDGKIRGYTLSHNDKSIMKSLNLRQTDVVTAVNGMPLNDPTSMYGLMGQLKDGGLLQLTIERNGEQQMIEINL